MKQRIFESVLSAILVSFVAFIVNGIIISLIEDKSSVYIGEAVEYSTGEYILPIDISTFSQEIEELQIRIPSNVSSEDIKLNFPLDISTRNNINGNTISLATITDIPSDSHFQIALALQEPVESKDIMIHGEKINVNYGIENKSPLKTTILSLLMSTILYVILLSVFSFTQKLSTEKRQKKIMELADERIEQVTKVKEDMDNQTKDLRTDLERQQKRTEYYTKQVYELEDSIKEEKEKQLKKQLLLKAQLYDYSKELNFWRDTIRKILYINDCRKSEVDKVMEVVSRNLKTYQTNDKLEVEFESLKVLSKIMSGIDSDGKK